MTFPAVGLASFRSQTDVSLEPAIGGDYSGDSAGERTIYFAQRYLLQGVVMTGLKA